MKTAEQIIDEVAKKYHKHFITEDKEIIEAMGIYASQALDECLKHERGDVVPEIEILKVRSKLK